jgi:hypothetical protein
MAMTPPESVMTVGPPPPGVISTSGTPRPVWESITCSVKSWAQTVA